MRLWSLHPKFLDAKGIVALWREGLLAQKVLQNRTKGYQHHPQLIRFRSQADALGLIGAYLYAVHKEATRRGYRFDGSKILQRSAPTRLTVTRGQIAFESQHLERKLKNRDHVFYLRLKACKRISSHPLFKIVAGHVEKWERPGPIQ